VATLEQIQRGVDFIEAHLEDEFALVDVASRAGMSLWHFQRTFKALTNETLKTYVRSRRFASALSRLSETEARIIEIALAAGYESQAAFTRAFKQAFELTPHQYRKLGRKNQFSNKVRFTPDYLAHINGSVSLQPVLAPQAALSFVGLQTHYYGVDSDKSNMAAKLPALWAAFVPRMKSVPNLQPGVAYGIIQHSPGEERLTYTAAVAVSGESAELPKDMVAVALPASEYAYFDHRGLVRALDHTVNFIYSSWLLMSGRRHTDGADLEIYGAGYHPSSEESVIQYAIPVR
jgi:AraC-like DNA-binding protein/predicted transcriptional regulator YdeE